MLRGIVSPGLANEVPMSLAVEPMSFTDRNERLSKVLGYLRDVSVRWQLDNLSLRRWSRAVRVVEGICFLRVLIEGLRGVHNVREGKLRVVAMLVEQRGYRRG